MASDTLGHHYNELPGIPVELLACDRCGTTQQQAMTSGIACQGEQQAHALAGMLAAIEYARTMHGGMAGQLDVAAVQEGLDFIAADAIQGQLDILGALTAITLRAASLASNVTGISVPAFLDKLQSELTGGPAPSPGS